MMARKRTKESWLNDMTPVCKKCGKPAPIRVSTQNWTVYDTSKPCECGGSYVARFMLEAENDGT